MNVIKEPNVQSEFQHSYDAQDIEVHDSQTPFLFQHIVKNKRIMSLQQAS